LIALQKPTLLLIDGSQVLMELTRRILERAGYSVRLAVGIAGAREWFADYTPDGIILEKELPDGSGLDFLRELREKSEMPVLFVSDRWEDELPALNAGASDYMKKPCNYDVMIARLGAIMKGVYRKSGDTEYIFARGQPPDD
jgi:DNA-binding response OmpR family regulator